MDNYNTITLEKLLPGICDFLSQLSKSAPRLSTHQVLQVKDYLSIIEGWAAPSLPPRPIDLAAPKRFTSNDSPTDHNTGESVYDPVEPIVRSLSEDKKHTYTALPVQPKRDDDDPHYYSDPDADKNGHNGNAASSDESDESFDPVESHYSNNTTSLKLPNNTPTAAHSLPNAVHKGDMMQKGIISWNKRYCVLLLTQNSGNDESGYLHCYKNSNNKQPCSTYNLQHYDISYVEKDGRSVMKLSRTGYDSQMFAAELSELIHWFEAIATFSKSCVPPAEDNSSTDTNPPCDNDDHSSKSKGSKFNTFMGRKKKPKKPSSTEVDIELAPDISVAGFVNIVYDGKKNFQSRWCTVNSSSGQLTCYPDKTSADFERSIPLASELEFVDRRKERKKKLLLTLNRKMTNKEVICMEFLDTLQHGDWLTAIVKEITICDKQHSTSNSNGSDSTSPLFTTDHDIPSERAPRPPPGIKPAIPMDDDVVDDDEHYIEASGSEGTSDYPKGEYVEPDYPAPASHNESQQSDDYDDDFQDIYEPVGPNSAGVVILGDATTDASCTEESAYENTDIEKSARKNKKNNFLKKLGFGKKKLFVSENTPKADESTTEIPAIVEDTEDIYDVFEEQYVDMGDDAPPQPPEIPTGPRPSLGEISMTAQHKRRSLPAVPVMSEEELSPGAIPEAEDSEEEPPGLYDDCWDILKLKDNIREENIQETQQAATNEGSDDDNFYDDISSPVLQACPVESPFSKPAIPANKPKIPKNKPTNNIAERQRKLRARVQSSKRSSEIIDDDDEHELLTKFDDQRVCVDNKPPVNAVKPTMTSPKLKSPVGGQMKLNNALKPRTRYGDNTGTKKQCGSRIQNTTASLTNNTVQNSETPEKCRDVPAPSPSPQGKSTTNTTMLNEMNVKAFNKVLSVNLKSATINIDENSDNTDDNDQFSCNDLYEEPIDCTPKEAVKCHEGPTINADKEILHTSKNPILEQIRQDRRSSSPGSGVGSPGSVRSRLSNGSSRSDSVDSSGIGSEDNTEDIAVEIKSLKQQLGDLRRKSAEVRSKKLSCTSTSEKSTYENLQKQHTKERVDLEDKLAELTIRKEEMVSLTSSSSLSPLRSSRYSSGVVKRTASDGHRYSGRLSTSDSTKSTTLTSTTTSTTSRVSRSTSSGFGRTTETRQQRAVKVSQMSQMWENRSKD